MDRDLRASLLAACTAAALSALVGVIAGVGFFILLIRALVFGLIIGAAAYGIIALAKRSLPGLLDAPETAGKDSPAANFAAAPEMGANVDIVLPGEAPGSEAEAAGVEAFGRGAGPGTSGAGHHAPSNGPFGDGTAEAEEPGLLEPEDASFEAEAAIPVETVHDFGKRSATGFDELDVLPDLDGFSDSFTASEFASGGASAERSEGISEAALANAGVAVPRTAQGSLDTAAMAQAVRTILKRDQKG